MSDIDAVFRAMADPTRRLILDELRQRDGQSLFEICVRLINQHGIGLTRQGVSKHLAILEEAGLVRTEWRGRTKLHTRDPRPIADIMQGWLASQTETKE